jgi:integrase
MADSLPVRKYIRVWVKRRKNNPRKGGQAATVSLTLEWVVYGQRQFMSLGPGATAAYARRMAAEKERQLNAEAPSETLEPVTWAAFRTKYFDTFYPGHELPPRERQAMRAQWPKSFASMRSERLAMDNFERIIRPSWCHQVTTAEREAFVTQRLAEVPSAASVDADLRVLRALFNVMEEWKHRPEGTNPFAGRGKATVGARRKRHKEQAHPNAAPGKHYTFDEVRAILARATQEATEAPTFARKRLRALVYFLAYTGCRFGEAVHLEWKDVDFERRVAWLYFKVENDLKTEGNQAPFGLPARLVEALREWERDRPEGVSWVFANAEGRPWKTGGPKYRPFDQVQALGERAGVKGANFKRFRHAPATHGKQRFGMSKEQVQAQLRHTTAQTQEHYTHDDIANLAEAVQGVDFDG